MSQVGVKRHKHSSEKQLNPIIKINYWASLLAQWLRICQVREEMLRPQEGSGQAEPPAAAEEQGAGGENEPPAAAPEPHEAEKSHQERVSAGPGRTARLEPGGRENSQETQAPRTPSPAAALSF